MKRADDLLTRITPQRWERRSCGEGSKGQRFYDWALFEVNVKDDHPADGFAYSLLIRRSVSDPDKVDYFLVHAPTGTTMSVMVACAGLRWKIEEDNRHGKQLIGLDDYQIRTWTAWHHQVTACMFAHAFLVLARQNLLATHTEEPGEQLPSQTVELEAPGKTPRPPAPRAASHSTAHAGSPRSPWTRSSTSSPPSSYASITADSTSCTGSAGASATRCAPNSATTNAEATHYPHTCATGNAQSKIRSCSTGPTGSVTQIISNVCRAAVSLQMAAHQPRRTSSTQHQGTDMPRRYRSR